MFVRKMQSHCLTIYFINELWPSDFKVRLAPVAAKMFCVAYINAKAFPFKRSLSQFAVTVTLIKTIVVLTNYNPHFLFALNKVAL